MTRCIEHKCMYLHHNGQKTTLKTLLKKLNIVFFRFIFFQNLTYCCLLLLLSYVRLRIIIIIVFRLKPPPEGAALCRPQPLRDKTMTLPTATERPLLAISYYFHVSASYALSPWPPFYLVRFGYCSSMSLLQGYVPLQAKG